MGLLKANVYASTDALDTEEGVKFFSEKAAVLAKVIWKFSS